MGFNSGFKGLSQIGHYTEWRKSDFARGNVLKTPSVKRLLCLLYPVSCHFRTSEARDHSRATPCDIFCARSTFPQVISSLFNYHSTVPPYLFMLSRGADNGAIRDSSSTKTQCWGFIIENIYYVNFGIRDSFSMLSLTLTLRVI